jgi:hypothetical protein
MQKISISGPAELLAVLPFHLGFRPHRSAVVVCFHERRMGLVVRVDVCPRPEAAEAAAQLVPALRSESPTHVMLVGYEDEAGVAAALCDALAELLADEGVEVTDRLVVRGDRWYGLMCDCCPEEGTPLRADADVPGVAGFVALGRTVLHDREALAALIEPAPDAPRHLGDAIREFVDELEWARRLVSRPPGSSFFPPGTVPGDDSELRRLADEAIAGWGRLLRGAFAAGFPDAALAALAGSLRDVHLRDALIAWLCPGTLPADSFEPALVDALVDHLGPIDERGGPGRAGRFGDVGEGQCGDQDREAVQARLEALCRAVPAEHAAPVLAVVASFAWWCGDGARASVALEKALELEPDHRLCALLRRLVGLGVRTDRASA